MSSVIQTLMHTKLHNLTQVLYCFQRASIGWRNNDVKRCCEIYAFVAFSNKSILENIVPIIDPCLLLFEPELKTQHCNIISIGVRFNGTDMKQLEAKALYTLCAQ